MRVFGCAEQMEATMAECVIHELTSKDGGEPNPDIETIGLHGVGVNFHDEEICLYEYPAALNLVIGHFHPNYEPEAETTANRPKAVPDYTPFYPDEDTDNPF